MTFKEFLKERNSNDLVTVEDRIFDTDYSKDYFGSYFNVEFWLDSTVDKNNLYEREIGSYYYCYNRNSKENLYKVYLW